MVELFLVLWFVVGLAGLAVCVLMVRRTQRRIERALGGPAPVKQEMPGAGDRHEKATVSVDDRRGSFRWEGRFEGKKASFFYEAETRYLRLQLESGSDVMVVADFARGQGSPVPSSVVPYKVEVNGRAVYRDDLLAGAEGPRLLALLEASLTGGLPQGAEQVPEALREGLEALLFGRRTFHRFLDHLAREFPAFWTQIREYRGRPLSDMLEAFRGGSKSREELYWEMQRAISAEDYQRAAAIRDQLRALEKPEPGRGE